MISIDDKLSLSSEDMDIFMENSKPEGTCFLNWWIDEDLLVTDKDFMLGVVFNDLVFISGFFRMGILGELIVPIYQNFLKFLG